MDAIVLRAMQKWPDVPHVYGWLRLDRRGQWWIKSVARGASGAFERIGNRAVIEFIGRNYGVDGRGRWFFQNGPQRVFVALEYLPWVYMLDARGEAMVSHTGLPADKLEALYLDEAGALVVQAAPGAGVVIDRDLPALLGRLEAENAGLAGDDDALERLASQGTRLKLFGAAVPVARLHSAEAPARFGFIQAPTPDPGEPEC